MARTSPARNLRRLIAERDESRGLLIAFEGPDGSGKTTQRKLLKTWLESRGNTVVSTRWASSALVKPLLKVRKRIRTLSTEEYSLLHAYSPLLWPDLVIYFSMTPEDSSRRVASARAPRFYEAGQDVTGLEDPLASYARFVDRVVTEYENLSLIFKFVTVDAGGAVYRQHTQVRELVEGTEKRPWPAFSKAAVEEWLKKSSLAVTS